MTATLSPSAVMATWYPATITTPDGGLVRKCRIYAAPEGLFVYTAPDVLAWHSPLTPGQPRPRTGWEARNGIALETAAGRVGITPEGGCGCGAPLKRWVPAWTGRSVAWV